MDLDQAADFFDRFLDAEHASVMASYTEQPEIQDEHRAAAAAFLHRGVGLTVEYNGTPRLSPDLMRRWRQSASGQVRRTLFQVAQYDNPEWGPLFAGFAGGTARDVADRYGKLYYAAAIATESKIISRYSPDFPSDDEIGRWEREAGVEIADPGVLIATRSFHEPAEGSYRQVWLALREAAGNEAV